MGVLNVTPDSFSDGGHYLAHERALERALEMVLQGADIIDVGGESSRPGASPVGVTEELQRIIPVVEHLASQGDVSISVDTTKAEVAHAALRAGAHIINDISSLRFDGDMAGVVAESGAGVVLMHMQGTPRTMQSAPEYVDCVGEVLAFLEEQATAAEAAGVARQSIAIDVGIGFGKTWTHNWQLVDQLNTFTSLGHPILFGPSRKRFLRPQLDQSPSLAQLDAATLAVCIVAVLNGATIVRVHDVAGVRAGLNTLAPLL